MKRLTHLVTNIVLISSLVFLLSCSTDDNAARKDDNPVRIGIAWRGDSTAITFVSALQSVRETGAVPVVLPLLKSPFMEYDGDQLMSQYTDEHGVLLQEYADKVKADPFAGQDIGSLLVSLDGLLQAVRTSVLHSTSRRSLGTVLRLKATATDDATCRTIS